MTSHVEQQIAARIAAAREKRQQRRQQRAELDAARIPGLDARHSAKMRRWAEEEDASRGDIPMVASARPADADDYPADDLRSPDGNAGVGQPPTTVGKSAVATPGRGAADLRGADGHAGVTETVTVAASRVDIDTVDDGGDE